MREQIATIRLSRSSGIGPVTFKHLVDKFGSAYAALENIPSITKGKKINVPSLEYAEKTLEKAEKKGIKIAYFFDSIYPRSLKNICDSPALLFFKGNADLFNKKSIAIIGSRNSSFQGIAFAEKISYELAMADFAVISGMAKGIDTAAHKGSLKKATIAVLAGGVDVIYPLENRDLYEQIAQGGLVISEADISKEPRPEAFTYRNRIISGISSGVLIVEAAFKSGTLITARYAADQGRDIFAVPGHPYDVRAAGANYLIKNGAFLTERASDIISHYSANSSFNLFDEEYQVASDKDENYENAKDYLMDVLSKTPVNINQIVRNNTFSVSAMQGAIAELDLMEKIIIEQGKISKA
jgi:DNA processing protein